MLAANISTECITTSHASSKHKSLQAISRDQIHSHAEILKIDFIQSDMEFLHRVGLVAIQKYRDSFSRKSFSFRKNLF
jgi:hypothetical protein